MRVKFPDNYVLEATFHPSDKIQSLIDLLVKAVARPDLPFYLCEWMTPELRNSKEWSLTFFFIYLALFPLGNHKPAEVHLLWILSLFKLLANLVYLNL